ncbi:MAG: hypothetical protein CMP08_06470 [Xanthomonadales bacterium]|nr:hypothetical protein [Xanthomonadales bacterium]MBH03750.1 hypothetical protein [Xanthomonadales bacterium]
MMPCKISASHIDPADDRRRSPWLVVSVRAAQKTHAASLPQRIAAGPDDHIAADRRPSAAVVVANRARDAGRRSRPVNAGRV